MIEELYRPFTKSERKLLSLRACSVRKNIDDDRYSPSIARHMERFRARLLEELDHGGAYVIHCAPKRIITREQIDDEGDSWIFDGGDGNYLALFGQDYCATGRFPSNNFELIFGQAHRAFFAIRSLASSHPPLSFDCLDDTAWEPVWQTDVWRCDCKLFAAPADLPSDGVLQTLASLHKTK